MEQRQEQLAQIVEKIGTPTFIYDEQTLNRNIGRILTNAERNGLRERLTPFISYFCNSNPHLFRILTNQRIGILLQSACASEYEQLQSFGVQANLMVSPSVLSDEEIDAWVSRGVHLNVASSDEVEYMLTKHAGVPLSFRLDLSKGEKKKRNGIKRGELAALSKRLQQAKVRPHSVHVYLGTDSTLDEMVAGLDEIFRTQQRYFPDVEAINLGGGFGFDYEKEDPEAKHFAWNEYFAALRTKMMANQVRDDMRFIIEPGRDVFADAGQLLMRVKRVTPHTRKEHNVAVDGSYVLMPSATMRKRQHRTTFLDKNFAELPVSDRKGYLSGSTTLSSDYVFPGSIPIPAQLNPSDYVLVHDAGAYAATQHMEFLNQPPPAEVLIDAREQLRLITERGPAEDKVRHVLREPVLLTQCKTAAAAMDIYSNPDKYKVGPDGMNNEVMMWFVASGLLLQEVTKRQIAPPFGGLAERTSATERGNLPSLEVLDVCSGPGNFVNHLALAYPELKATCVDRSEKFIESGNENFGKLGWRFLLDDVVRMKLGRTFPAITASSAYHHIEDQDKVAFLRNLVAHLDEDGFILMCENILPRYQTLDGRRDAVDAYYGALKGFYALGNATDAARDVIDDVHVLEKAKIEEHKICWDVFADHIEQAGLEVATDMPVWQPPEFQVDRAGSHVMILKRKQQKAR